MLTRSIVILSLFQDALQKAILSSLAPPPWELGTFTTLSKTLDPISLWNKFVDGMVIESALRDTIQKELSSSLYWQSEIYPTLKFTIYKS